MWSAWLESSAAVSRSEAGRSVAHHEPILYFLHIPKTAGMSLTALLETWVTRFFCSHDAVCRSIDLYDIVQNHWAKLRDYQFFRGYMGYQLVPLLGVPVEVIVVLRHPYDQVHSWYKHIMRVGPAHFMYGDARHHDFEGFIWDERCRAFISNSQSQHLAVDFGMDVDFLRRSETMTAVHREHLRLLDGLARRDPDDLYRSASAGLAACRWVGVTEQLDSFVHVLSRAFDWPLPEEPLDRMNVSADQAPAIARLPPRSLKRLRQLLAVDLRIYVEARRRLRVHCAQSGVQTGSTPSVWKQNPSKFQISPGAAADCDRAARSDQVQVLTEFLYEANVDRQARFEQIQELTRLLHEADSHPRMSS